MPSATGSTHETASDRLSSDEGVLRMPHRIGGATTSVMTRIAILSLTVALVVLAGCDDDDTHTTARVERITTSQVCLVPEDRRLPEIEGCFPYSTPDRQKLQIGACISVRVPNYLDESRRADPIYDVHVLHRPCKR
jgi:hypothetical protein